MKKFTNFLAETMLIEAGTRLGSNPGGIHTDSIGQKHYVKQYANPDQAKVEALTGRVYHHMGIKTVEPKHIGNGVVSSQWNPHLSTMRPHEFENLNHEQAGEIGRMHAAAVVTKNWDIVGLEHDNILRHKDTGELHALDHGGAFHFRARGRPKDFGPDIAENHSLRSNHEASGHVFSTVFSQHPHAESVGIHALRNMDTDAVHSAFKESGLHNWEDLHHNFQQRRQALLDQHSNPGG
jgi:hypothetical protein